MTTRQVRRTSPAIVAVAIVAAVAAACRADETAPLLAIGAVLHDTTAVGRRPVRIRGVVTWRRSNHHGLVVQDDSGGIWVDVSQSHESGLWRGDAATLAAVEEGNRVEVEGLATRGGFSPNVLAIAIRPLGPGQLPEARPIDPERFFSGADDCLRVVVEGVLQGAPEDGGTAVLLESDGKRFTAELPITQAKAAAGLVDARLRLTGVAACSFNTRGEFLAPRLLVAAADPPEVVSPPPGPPFAAVELPLSSIAKYQPTAPDGHRIRTRGIVTHAVPGSHVYLQQGLMGVRVESRSQEPLAAGDEVEAAGFVDRSPPVAALVEAVLQRLGPGPPLVAVRIDPATVVRTNAEAEYHGRMATPGDYHGCLVNFPARLLDLRTTPLGGELVLTSGSTGLNAIANAAAFKPLAQLQPGSELSVTGIVAHDRVGDDPRHWSPRPVGQLAILLRTAADIQVIRHPSWWTSGRLAALLAAVASVALAAAAWGLMLRRQVRRQLAIIETKLQGEAATEERHRIAREFHDTLEQDLAGIALRLDAAAHRATDEQSRTVLDEQRGLLARLQAETHDFLWDLRDPTRHDGSLLESVRSQVAFLQSLTDVPVRLDAAAALPRVPPLVQYHLLRIMREAVNNAIKYAESTTIGVRVAADEAGLALTVTDNGIGFNVDGREALEGHFGIRGMRERTRRIKAACGIQSHPGQGTHIRVTVPAHVLSEPTMANPSPSTHDPVSTGAAAEP